ncbi:hypothetical protein [Rubinisphaera margarita]|uniref:hypothetical protein n=1 Tax=Rubinisphaera margarita TaxID=2909586 RepID=UPI001EE98FEE|nr:hypothetical protein [Rubinisphaera margarita]MCG6154266.1 hypothetical protein [Rubinisphaera margarita]
MSIRNRLRLAACQLALICAVLFSGCSYGEVSGNTYQYAKALYSICNRHDAEGLEKASRQIAAAEAQGEITTQEAEWLQEIVAEARNDHWEDAMQDCRQMMEDQIGQP